MKKSRIRLFNSDLSRLVQKVLNSNSIEFEKFKRKAEMLTEDQFGVHRIFFNPIYVSNVCINDCPYCGYRKSNKNSVRRTLSPYETEIEAKFLRERGIRHILVLAGNYSKAQYLDMLIRNLEAINRISRPVWLGIEVNPLDVEEYEILSLFGIKSVTVFQETYDKRRYSFLHKNRGPKEDFYYRFNSLQRAIDAGILEVGLGVLYGIGYFYEDTISMVNHASELTNKNDDIKLRFSFPRLKSSELQSNNIYKENISEDMLLRAVVAIRLAFPNANLVLTGRESTDFLLKCISIVNVVGKDGSTAVGGYCVANEAKELEQFRLNKDNNFDKFKNKVLKEGYLIL